VCATHKAALVRAAADYLACEGHAGRKFVVTLSSRDARFAVVVREWPAPGPDTTGPPEGYRKQSQLEARIVKALAGGDWTTTKEIAAAVGEEPDGDIRAILRNLVEAGELEGGQAKGFRLPRKGGTASATN